MAELHPNTGMDVSLESVIRGARSAERAGAWKEAIRGYTEALRRIESGEQPTRKPELLRSLGRVHFERGEYERAADAFERSLIAAQRLGLRRECASALNAMAVVAQFRGLLDVAELLYQRASVMAEEVSASRLCAIIEMNLGTLAGVRGDVSTALLRYQSARDRFRRLHDVRSTATAVHNIAILHREVGELAEAEVAFNEAWLLAERENDHATMARIECGRADLYLERQQYEHARECLERAFRAFNRLGSDSGLSAVHRRYGVLYRETGKPGLAHAHFTLALRLARACEDPLLEAEAENERARQYVEEKRFRHALRALMRAHRLYIQLDARREMLDVRRRLERLRGLAAPSDVWAEEAADDEQAKRRGRRVAEYALRLAHAMGYRDTDALKVGAYLYDIGNSGLPRHVLEKPGPLTAEERALVQQHTLLGAEIVNELDFPIDVRPMIRHHHEHFDGSGYPDALRGDEIPVAARILCIADAFDALTSDRSDRPAFSVEEALEIMESEAGRVFDPEMFALFRQLMMDAGAKQTDDRHQPRGLRAAPQ